MEIGTEYLNLSFFGEIEDREIQKILQLKSLRHLNISSSDIVDKHLEIIGKNGSIEILDLDLTEITDQGIRSIEALKMLKQLKIKDNPQLTDTCIEYLSQIRSLELIHIGNTSITIDGIKRLLLEVDLESIIIESEFDDLIEELLIISSEYPILEITLKGTGIILNGKLNQ